MLKFVITAERLANCATVPEYTAALMGSTVAKMKLLPKFLVDSKTGQYVVDVITDEDGDIVELKGLQTAQLRMDVITPRRLEKLFDEMGAALREVVNPTKGGG